MERLWRDVRLAVRRLRRERGFALIAVATLALGIGANTAIFSIVESVLLRPLAYPQPEELISLHESIPQVAQQYPEIPVSADAFAAWRSRSKLLASLALIEPDTMDLTGAGEPQQVVVFDVSASLFQVLGEGPRLGRAFLPQEDQPHANHEVILSDAFWRSQFHADPGVLGRTLDLDGHANQIVGVLPASFHFPKGEELGPLLAGSITAPAQLFRPIGLDLTQPDTGNWNYGVFARMRPGARSEQVRAELNAITATTPGAKTLGHNAKINVVVTPLQDQIVGNHRLGLWLLLAAVGAILLIVCLNLANLLLVRVHGRGHEAAIRLALGASRGRLLRETVTEGVLLALAGGAVGVPAAIAAVRWLVASAPSGVPRLDEVHVNAVALVFALVLALACGALFSLWPAWRAARTDPQAALRAGGRGASEGGGRNRARAWLVGAQCALTALLLIVAGLLAASYLRLNGVNKGFQANHVLSVEAEWTAGSHVQRAAFYQAVLAKLASLPGVRGAGLINILPTQGSGDVEIVTLPGDTRPMFERPLANFRAVSPGYFGAMGIALLRGRTFTDTEMAAALVPKSTRVAVLVSAATAAKLWPGRDAVGQPFTNNDNTEPTFTVVGVVGDVRSDNLQTPPGLMVYWPYTYEVPDDAAFALRTPAAPTALAGAARAAIWSAQPAATIPKIETMGQVVADSIASRRFQMSLVIVFAMVALLLAGLGVYGVVAYAVACRKQEIGIRITLGAESRHLIGMVLRQGLTPVVLGLLAGVLAALAAGRLLGSLLFGVHASDPAVIAVVAALLLAVAALACALPARRAARTDPRVVISS